MEYFCQNWPFQSMRVLIESIRDDKVEIQKIVTAMRTA